MRTGVCVCMCFLFFFFFWRRAKKEKKERSGGGGWRGDTRTVRRGDEDAGADACRLEGEAAADCRKNGSEEEGKRGAASREKRGEIQRAARRNKRI